MWHTLRWGLLGMVVCLSVAATAATGWGADSPATRPGETGDASTPKGALFLADRTVPTGGLEAALTFYQATTEHERDLARCAALLDVACGHLEEAVVQKFGRPAADQAIHALGGKVASDVERATEKTDRNKALIQWKDGREPLHMIKVGGSWKVDVSAEVEGMDDQELQQDQNVLKHMAVSADRLADQVAGGKWVSLKEVIDACNAERDMIQQMEK
jgi:hypothetical protein